MKLSVLPGCDELTDMKCHVVMLLSCYHVVIMLLLLPCF